MRAQEMTSSSRRFQGQHDTCTSLCQHTQMMYCTHTSHVLHTKVMLEASQRASLSIPCKHALLCISRATTDTCIHTCMHTYTLMQVLVRDLVCGLAVAFDRCASHEVHAAPKVLHADARVRQHSIRLCMTHMCVTHPYGMLLGCKDRGLATVHLMI